MTLPAFASVELRMSQDALVMLTNLYAVKGGVSFSAHLARDEAHIGVESFSSERMSTLTYIKSSLPVALKRGDIVTADSAIYTAGELADMEQTSWTVDGVDHDDGHLARVFVR